MNVNWIPELFEFCDVMDLNPYTKTAVDQFKEFKKSGLTL